METGECWLENDDEKRHAGGSYPLMRRIRAKDCSGGGPCALVPAWIGSNKSKSWALDDQRNTCMRLFMVKVTRTTVVHPVLRFSNLSQVTQSLH